jgi:hypothetical protein
MSKQPLLLESWGLLGYASVYLQLQCHGPLRIIETISKIVHCIISRIVCCTISKIVLTEQVVKSEMPSLSKKATKRRAIFIACDPWGSDFQENQPYLLSCLP